MTGVLNSLAGDRFVGGDEFLISQSSFGVSADAHFSALPDGGFVAVWQDETAGVEARFFDADGNPTGDTFLVGDASGTEPSAVVLSNGNIVFSWLHQSSPGNFYVRAQITDGTGVPVGNAMVVASPSIGSTDLNTHIAALSGGGFVVTWEVYNSSSDVMAQVFAADGSKVGGQIIAAGPGQPYPGGSTVTALAGGGFVVTWTAYSDVIDGAGNPGVRAQLFDASGAAVGGIIPVNSVLEGSQGGQAAAALPDGGFVIAWTDTQDTANLAQDGIWFQRFDATGARVGNEVHVTSGGVGGVRAPSIEIVPGTGFIVVWPQSDTQDAWFPHLTGQLYNFTGAQIGQPFDLGSSDPGTQSDPELTVLAGGRILTGWIDTVTDPDSASFRAQILYPLVHGTTGPDTIVGTDFRDFISAGAGNDTLDGGPGNDTLYGGTGDDTYAVDSSGDVVIENPSEGTDIVYSSANFVLPANVENLTLTGSAAINGAGNELANVILGNSADNILDGGGGADTMAGGLGNDTYVVDNASDLVTEYAGQGVDLVESSITYTLGDNIENLNLVGSAAINGTGNDLDNVITGNDAANVLSGGLGNDILNGGAGNDTLNGGAGADTLTGGAGADTFTGTAAALNGDLIADFGAGDRIVISDANLSSFKFSYSGDTLTYSGGELSVSLPLGMTVVASAAPEGGVQLTLAQAPGTAGTFAAFSAFDINSLNLNWYHQNATGASFQKAANVVLDGHTYADAFGVQASDASNAGELDFLGSGFTQDASGAITGGTVNAVAEFSNGTLLWVVEGVSISAVDLYNASLTSSNADELGLIEKALAGNDTIMLSEFDDHMNGYAGNDSMSGGGGNDVLSGGTGDDILEGGAGNDTLDGGAGSDTATYQDATTGVTVSLALTVAQDTVGSGIDTLTGIENLRGSAFADTLTGNGAANVLYGGAGNDTLDGGAGADSMYGGQGNDTFVVRDATDVVVENAGEGIDTICSTISLTLAANVENLTLLGAADLAGTGNALDNVITGNAGANILYGGAGNDTLDGGAGADRMYGGTGNDTYVVRDATDRAFENAGEGSDIVISSINYTLGANLENLTLSGTANLTGKGNELANVLIGNSGSNSLYGNDGADILVGNAGNDRLDGGAGVDSMAAGTGNDTYYVDAYGDKVIENAGEGTDTVYASASYKLSANVERLTLTGTADIYGYGNDLDNVVTGNSGANKLYGMGGNDALDGKGGVDTMSGGTGNDRYYVDCYGDKVIENAGEGTDSVYASASYKLGANIENLTLTGSADLFGYANDLDNALTGNSGSNKLYGMAGNDTIKGGAGNDWIEGGAGKDMIYGGTGSDSFVFRDGDFGGATAATADRIMDFSQGEDAIRLNYVDANTALTGDQAFHFIGTAAFDGTVGELRYQEISGATYVSGDTNGDGVADFMIRLDGLHALTAHDFVL